MQFEFVQPAPVAAQPHQVRVGDVFKAKASGPYGRNRGTRYWVVASITQTSPHSAVHHLLGLNAEGAIVSTTSYGGHVMPDRERVGYCPDLAAQRLRVEWQEELP